MKPSKPIVILILLLQLFLAPAQLLAKEAKTTVIDTVRMNAGGWGLATPMIIGGIGIYQHLRHKDSFEKEDILNREVLGGLTGDFLTVAAFSAIAPALPVAPLLRSFFVMFGGFLGWEIGSGNLKNTDWAGILAQAGAATLVKQGLMTMMATGGLSLGPVAVTALSIGSAMAVAILLEKFRDRGPESEASERSSAPSEKPLRSPAAGAVRRFASPESGFDESGKASSAEEYRTLLRSLQSGDLEAARRAHEEYSR